VIFGKLKRKSDNNADTISILAPISGELVPISEVNDPTFSEEMLGKGVAIRPSAGRVVSPVHGTVTQLFETGHAVTLTSHDGAQVLIHVGLDTIRLKGTHYTPCIKEGNTVNPGDLLIEFDQDAIAADGFDTVTPVVICNSDEFDYFTSPKTKLVQEGDEIISFMKK